MEEEGGLLICLVLRFVFEVANKAKLPEYVKKKFVEYPRNTINMFEKPIADALIVIMTDTIGNEGDLYEINSRGFIKESEFHNHRTLLNFIGRYSVKAFSEYMQNSKDAPQTFLERAVRNMANNVASEENCKEHYLQTLKEEAARIVNENQERIIDPFLYKQFDDFFDMYEENALVIDTVNYLFQVFEQPNEPNPFIKPESPFSQLSEHIINVFGSSIEHHTRYAAYGNQNQLKEYFLNRCIKAFNEKDFLELCVWVVKCYTVEETLRESTNVFFCLKQVLNHAKRAGKFSIDKLTDEAQNLCLVFADFRKKSRRN